MKTKRQRIIRNGFTLIEMLAVVAIIMILAALLLPSISKARAKAIRSKCLNHIRQTDLVVLMYGQDNNDRVPYNFSMTTLPLPMVDTVLRSRISPEILFDPGIDGQSTNWAKSGITGRQIGYCLTLPGPTNMLPVNANATIIPQAIYSGTNKLTSEINASLRVLVAGVTGAKTNGAPAGVAGAAHLDSKDLFLGDNVAMLDGSAKWRPFNNMIPRTTRAVWVNDFYWYWW